MQKSIKIRKLIPFIVAIAAALLIAITLGFSGSFGAFAADNKGEGNNVGDANVQPDVELVLDVNGRDASNAALSATRSDENFSASDDQNDFYVNNQQHLKVRNIAASAVVDAYNDKHSTGYINNDFHFDGTTIRYDCKEIEVKAAESDPLHIIVTAKEKTRVDSGVRFSVVMVSSNGETTFPVYFKVSVQDTFAQHANKAYGGLSFNDQSEYIRVGGKLKDGVEEKSDYLVLINNYSQWQFDLVDYLADRVLYINDESDTNYTKPVRMSDAAAAPYWMISSTNNFTVQSLQFAATSGFTDTLINNPTKTEQHSAGISTTLSLSSSKINSYVAYQKRTDPSYDIDKFWAETHDIQIILNTADDAASSNRLSILIPVKFRADKPQKTAIPSSYLNLTVTSDYICDYSGGSNRTTVYKVKDGKDEDGKDKYKEVDRETIAVAGYGSIIIRPSDLVDYCFPSVMNGKQASMTFDAEGTSTGSESGSYMLSPVDTEPGMEMFPNAYRVIALKNDQYAINFRINYNIETSDDFVAMDVLVTIIGDGAYTVVIPTIEGKDAVVYNVMSASQFKQLRDADYIMTDVDSNNKSQLTATLKNNKLTLKPNVDKIKGTTSATITMTFTNTNGQKLVLTSKEFNIDVEAGSFWSRFEDWEAWLIIAAMIIGGIIIILLIVWLFIRAISKRRQEENATQAPVSSYIVKLNSTIAATQAQQRLAATQALSQASSQMLLGAGPTGTPAAAPDTLQLATGIPSSPQSTAADSMPSEPAATSAPKEPEENYDELIAQYISDEELLERIFVEKYEPKGMVRRTFFKSKDLQARELDKEKKRIIERYKTPMPMDEAIMSEAEINKADAPATSSPQETVDDTPKEVFVLDFDPYAPLYVESEKDEFSAEKIDIDVSPEESALNDVEHRNSIIEKELSELKARIDKVQKELDKNKSAEDILREKIAKAEADDEKYAKDIEDLEFKLASAKQKEKDRITRDINTAEAKKSRNLDNLEKLRAELEALLGGGNKLSDIMVHLNETRETKISEQSGIAADLQKAQSDYDAYQDRLAKVKARQELETKIEGLNSMLVAVNNADYEMRGIDNSMEKLAKERETLKSEVAAAKAQILGAKDFDVINELNSTISGINARLSEIEREVTKSTKRKSELNIEFTSQRRKANDYVEKNEIPLEDLIAAEDLVVGNIELDSLRALRESDREIAEGNVAAAQAQIDDITASATDLTMIAMEIASDLQQLETELAEAQAELDGINAQMEAASDDEKLMLMVDQGDKSDKVEELKQKIEQANIEGTKRKIEAQTQYDERIEAARAKLDEATAEFNAASTKYDILAETNPLELIMSGCGIISQDQKKIEAANLKKQLEKSKNEIEQARLAAEMAQMEAEQARVDAARASDEARAEAERAAQEAIEKAEAARLEAEEKARKEAEAADASRREAEEAADRARREAEEAANASILEAEQAKREALEAAEQARREAEEAAENARREAEEAAEIARREAEEAKREAEEASERARREAEEALQAEAEEAKRKAQEEIDEMRRKAEEEAEAKRLEAEKAQREEEERLKAEADRKDAIAAKVAARKEKIVVLRERMKDIKGNDDAKNLREQLYALQLAFDEEEKGSVELMDFYNKTMDDIQHAGEVADLKAENAKKPKRIIRKVTERVNRKPKKKARPGARPGAAGAARRPASGAARRPASGAARRPASGAARRPTSGAARRPSGTRPPRGR